MRLIQCHIENFGKLHDVTIDFHEGLNQICQKNGWGKSTLGAFLRVMLYGFEGESKRTNHFENERKRYEPWQGGVYGGSLTFALGDKQYIVNRIFKDKVANDIFELRDANTNLESNDFSEHLGEELFKINSEAFMRTSFIKQQDCTTSTNDSIYAKIGNLAESANDLNNYEAADAALKDVLNKMNPRVKRGTIHQMNEEITRLKQEVSDGKSLDASIEAIRKYYDDAMKSLDDLKHQKAQISKEQENISRYQDILVKKESYDLLCKDEAEKEIRLKNSLEKFANGVPTEVQVKEALEQCSRLERMLSADRAGRLSDAEQKEYDILRNIFVNGIPQMSTLQMHFNTAKRIDTEELRRNENYMNRDEEAKYSEEKVFFGNENPSAEINRLQQRWSERGILKNTISMQQVSVDGEKRRHAAELMQMKKQSVQKKGLGLAGLILGVATAVVFVVMDMLPGLILSVVLVLAGIIMLAVSGKKGMITEESVTSLEKELLVNKQRAEEIEREVEIYFARHDLMYSEESVLMQLQQLLNRALTFENLVEKHKKATSEVKEDFRMQKTELEEFLAPYQVFFEECAHHADRVSRLIQKCEQYLALHEKAQKSREVSLQLLEVRQELSEFLKTYGLLEIEEELLRNKLQHMLEDVAVHKTLADAHAVALLKKEEFKKQNNMEEILKTYSETQNTSLQELQEQFASIDEQIEVKRSQIKTYEEQLNQLHEKYDEWISTKELLEEKEAELKEQKKQYALLEKTRDFLGRAKEELTLRYTGPIMEHFAYYYSVITGEKPDAYKMDANIRLTINEQGLQRDTVFFSTGYQDLIGVCLRIALVEAMYSGEKPMLVMDDPFVNLDEEKSIGSRRLLDELAKHYQVLYFTCK